MKYQVLYDPKAGEQLEKLPRSLTKRIVKKIREVGETDRALRL